MVPSKHFLIWRSLQDVFKTCLEDVFNTSSVKQFSVFQDVLKTSSRLFVKMSWRCLEEILEDVLKTPWKKKDFLAEDVFKTSWRHVLKKSWRHVLKMSWGHVLKTSLRCYGDKQISYWGHLYLKNLNTYLTNLYFTNIYLIILRRNQNALKPIISIFVLFWKSSSISISRIKISDDCLEL